jgi:phosphomevalonate kinase
VQVSVPGNLLLLGEYAVLEEGGLGIALAVERRLTAGAEPADELILTGEWGGGQDLRWSEVEPGSSALVTAVVAACRERLQILGRALPRTRIHVDSTPLFLGGRKGGFGSSAAVAVALTWVLLGLASGRPDAKVAAEVALGAHRRAQGGQGSGYDVFASSFGGVGLFTGGERPSWEPLRLDWLAPLFLSRGPRSVSTPQAIECYRRWRAHSPGKADGFLRDSNRCVLGFARSGSRTEAASWLARSRELGLHLGERIGVDASLPRPDPSAPGELKALGAGNELGLYFPDPPPGSAPPGLSLLAPAPEGPRWTP